MTDPTRDLLISLASHMAYMQGQLEAHHQFDDPEDYYWFRESVALRQKVADALADEPAAPAPPVDGEVAELVAWLQETGRLLGRRPDIQCRVELSLFTRAAELLQQQATAYAICERERLHQSTRAADLEVERQALVPVAVSERLPGPEDCDADLYCWRWNAIGRLWARQPLARKWYEFESHWLPAHALPLPEVNNG